MAKQYAWAARRSGVLLVVGLAVLLWSPGGAVGKSKKLTEKDMMKLYGILETGDHYKVRIHACKVLGMLRKEESLPYLIKAVRKDPDHLVRSTCAWALGALNHPGAIADLEKTAKNEVTLVKKQAKRALNHILASFPNNLPARGYYNIIVDHLQDKATDDKELAKWVQQYFLEHLMRNDNVSVGTEMNIEEDGELPEIDEDFKPYISLAFQGGVMEAKVPPKRGAGTVEVSISVELLLMPGKLTAAKKRKYLGKAPFAGGPKPESEWDDDPLVESEKKALKNAVDKSYKDIAKLLKLKK